MVLHDVTHGANLLVKGTASLNSKILCHSDLNALDMSAVPERFEHLISEPKEKHAVNRLFAQVMIDSVNRLLVERLEQDLIESLGRRQISTERLLDDDTCIARAFSLR